MIALALMILQVTPESRAAGGLDAFAWTFMLLSMAAVTTLTVWCYARILGRKEHFDPDGIGPAHSPVGGEAEQPDVHREH